MTPVCIRISHQSTTTSAYRAANQRALSTTRQSTDTRAGSAADQRALPCADAAVAPVTAAMAIAVVTLCTGI